MKRILNLIRNDIITMNGGKNSMKTVFVILFLFCAVTGFFVSPIMGLYCPLLMGGFFSQMIFSNEVKYHSEKLQGVLPIARKELVISRYILVTGAYLIAFLLFYLMMFISLKVKPYYIFWGEDAENIDIIAMVAKMSGNSFTELGLFNLLYFGVFAFGLMMCTSSLRKHFKDAKSMSSELTMVKKASKQELIFGILILAIVILWFLIVTDILPLGTAFSVVLQLFLQLAQSADGFLLASVLVAWGVTSAIYTFICTLLEYEEKEL